MPRPNDGRCIPTTVDQAVGWPCLIATYGNVKTSSAGPRNRRLSAEDAVRRVRLRGRELINTVTRQRLTSTGARPIAEVHSLEKLPSTARRRRGLPLDKLMSTRRDDSEGVLLLPEGALLGTTDLPTIVTRFQRESYAAPRVPLARWSLSIASLLPEIRVPHRLRSKEM